MSQPPPIYVTQPYLPPLDEFIPYLREIWDKKILTNAGPFHARFEKALCEYLEVEHVALFANGTIGLVTALQALRVTGEVITTPYSFVATAHSLLWNGNKPVFVDIEPHSLTIDAAKIEAAITSETTAILAVHCYGHPCDVDAIQKIADNYNLRVIYDAAHAFGVRHGSGSLLTHGDLSVLSFHATKVFNTFEGGAIVCPTAKIKLQDRPAQELRLRRRDDRRRGGDQRQDGRSERGARPAPAQAHRRGAGAARGDRRALPRGAARREGNPLHRCRPARRRAQPRLLPDPGRRRLPALARRRSTTRCAPRGSTRAATSIR